MKHLTVGVAGHIDHGKTALVRALTAIETDRLKEEQERGMSIVLGFAHLALPGGEIDFIDVPGHEKFVKTMISGATGIDSALLVVAANERIKPQTIEHVALLGLLGVKQGIVAVTKSDLISDTDERELIQAELRAFLSETFLRDAPLVFVSALNGDGIDALNCLLEVQLAEAEAHAEWPCFTLPIDRVFTISGQGTIATGTLRRGAIKVGQNVEILPGGGRAEVRGLEVHGQPVTAAQPGWRTAVNLRGVKKDEISHGDTLATSGFLRPTRFIDAEVTQLAAADKPLKRGQSVMLHYGTSEVSARVYPLGTLEIAPGETTFAQFRLSEDRVATYGERFVLRLLSPVETIGGGRVIDAYPEKHTRVDEEVIARVQTLANGSPVQRLAAKLEEAGVAGADLSQMARDYAVPDTALLSGLPMVGCGSHLALHRSIFDALTVQAAQSVGEFHAKKPTRRGMPLEELRRGLPRLLKPSAFQKVMLTLSELGTLETVDGLVRSAGHDPESALSSIEREIACEIEDQFRDGSLKPPDIEAVLKRDRRRKTLYHYLLEAGKLVLTTERATGRVVIFHQDAITRAIQGLSSALAGGDGLTVSELNQTLNTTRKFSIPLLEYIDSLGMTRRVGDLRYWNGVTDKIDN